MHTSDHDAETGAVPNAKCGYGKLNIHKLLLWNGKGG